MSRRFRFCAHLVAFLMPRREHSVAHLRRLLRGGGEVRVPAQLRLCELTHASPLRIRQALFKRLAVTHAPRFRFLEFVCSSCLRIRETGFEHLPVLSTPSLHFLEFVGSSFLRIRETSLEHLAVLSTPRFRFLEFVGSSRFRFLQFARASVFSIHRPLSRGFAFLYALCFSL